MSKNSKKVNDKMRIFVERNFIEIKKGRNE